MKILINPIHLSNFPCNFFFLFCRILLCVFLALRINFTLAWDGPVSGPKAQSGKKIAFIASDFQNGSVITVYRSLEVAAHKLSWQLQLENGKGNESTQEEFLSKAIKQGVDAIVFGGFPAKRFPKIVASAKAKNIALVGWHADMYPGPTKELFTNVTTDATMVAKLAAEYVIHDAKKFKKKLGVVIFNDGQHPIANLKVKTMVETIAQCKGHRGCKVLSVEDISISKAAKEIPQVIPKLLSAYKNSWTHSLAINDIYFDTIHYPLIFGKRSDIVLVSAGDGSEKAIRRIRSGHSQQVATIGEPLDLQGFQIADEINRALAGQKHSGYVSKPLLLTVTSLNSEKNFSQDSDFKRAYFSIWNVKQ